MQGKVLCPCQRHRVSLRMPDTSWTPRTGDATAKAVTRGALRHGGECCPRAFESEITCVTMRMRFADVAIRPLGVRNRRALRAKKVKSRQLARRLKRDAHATHLPLSGRTLKKNGGSKQKMGHRVYSVSPARFRRRCGFDRVA